MKIAVIGAGIAGITAAYLLAKQHDVTLIERNDYIGGHTNTISVSDRADRIVPVDTGFIVCNPKTYPLFYGLLEEWGVRLRDSEMSFGYTCERSGIAYTGPSVREFMRRPANALKPAMIAMFLEQRRFNCRAARDLETGALDDLTLGAYLRHVGASDFFVEHYLIPLAAAVWSSPDTGMLRFPARTFIRFFANHGMLELRKRPTWQTVVGGSRAYVEAFLGKFGGVAMTDAPVRSVRRHDAGVTVELVHGAAMPFDCVVLASHADESLAVLADPSPAETDLLSAWTYHRNPTVLHTDASLMPPDRRLWASWNYTRRAGAAPDAPVSVHYYMNRLQGLRTDRDYFVSLNASERIDPEKVIYSVAYTHPAYSARSIAAQPALRALNGERRTYFCGSYMGYGFHEDAVASSVAVAEKLGVSS